MSLTTRLKLIQIRPRLFLNPFLLLTFTVVLIREFLYWLPKDAYGTGLNYWAYTDWLIDYSQGFIRRGLSGEIWRLVPTTVSPVEFVAVFSWILILVITFGYIRLLARSWKIFHPLTLFGLLFLPSLFIFYLHDHDAIARKEILGYVTVLLHALIIERTFSQNDNTALFDKNLKHYIWWMLPITMFFIPAIILVHEGNFLLFVPFHAMVTFTVFQMKPRSSFRRSLFWTSLMYVPAVLTFGVVFLAGTPSYHMLLGICEKWAAAGAIREGSCFLPPEKLSNSTLPGSFIPMEWSLAKAAYITRQVIFMNWIAWVLILPTLFIMLWYLGRQALYTILRSRSLLSFSQNSALLYSGLFFRKFFCIPFLLSLPVYFTAYDYGRWFTVACINYSILVVSANLPCLEFACQKMTEDEGSFATGSQEHLDHYLIFYGVSIIICILALILWLPHFCLFSCEVIRNPIGFFYHAYKAH